MKRKISNYKTNSSPKQPCVPLLDGSDIRERYRKILIANPHIKTEEDDIVIIDADALDSCSGILIP